jgi:hypothetical protein
MHGKRVRVKPLVSIARDVRSDTFAAAIPAFPAPAALRSANLGEIAERKNNQRDVPPVSRALGRERSASGGVARFGPVFSSIDERDRTFRQFGWTVLERPW